MKSCVVKVFFVFGLLFVLVYSSGNETELGRIELTNVTTLTFTKDQMTAARRTTPVSQLKCIGDSTESCSKIPNFVECTNTGYNASEIKWSCNGDLPKNIKFGKIDILCEGYENDNDTHVLNGSCSLKYSLVHIKAFYSTIKIDIVVFSIFMTMLTPLLICCACSRSCRDKFWSKTNDKYHRHLNVNRRNRSSMTSLGTDFSD